MIFSLLREMKTCSVVGCLVLEDLYPTAIYKPFIKNLSYIHNFCINFHWDFILINNKQHCVLTLGAGLMLLFPSMHPPQKHLSSYCTLENGKFPLSILLNSFIIICIGFLYRTLCLYLRI